MPNDRTTSASVATISGLHKPEAAKMQNREFRGRNTLPKTKNLPKEL